jgi:hypothetical protein
MTPKILLNGSDSVNYLIHGQDLNLNFSFPKAWFVLIRFNSVPKTAKYRQGSFWWFQRWHYFRRNGEFQSKVNIFHPRLTLFVFGWGIKKIKIQLNVEKINLKQRIPYINLPSLSNEMPLIPSIQIAGFQKIYHLELKEFGLIKNMLEIESIQLPWKELEQRIIEKNQ